MPSGDKGKLTVSEVSTVRETGRIPEGYTEELQIEIDGENRIYFLNPDTVKAAKDNPKVDAVIVLDADGRERGIPLDWVN